MGRQRDNNVHVRSTNYSSAP